MIIPSSVSPALKAGLQFLGMWPNRHSIVHWLGFMLSMLVSLYFQFLYIFDHLKLSELSNLVDCLIVTLDYSLTMLKMTSLWVHRRVFYKILIDMDNDWRECINADHHLCMMTIKANISHLVSNALLSLNAIVAILYLLGDYVIRSVFFTLSYNDTFRQFPIKIQFPFETQESPIFEILVVTLILHVIMHSCAIAILNGLILTLSIHNQTGIFILVRTICAYFVVMIEAFVICFAGEYLSLKSKLIGNAIYETMWYDMPLGQNKIIIFIIMRSQKQLTITAGKMMDMSFETFTSVISKVFLGHLII
ncbi:hypothetical protein PUN28_001123 [Cardiocondyla obscurior]|uniref:Odorant receptor n=1 Tax=Cardiocondyla obscurior TaxID=286306 RepID=A0AAW2H346_9HYME